MSKSDKIAYMRILMWTFSDVNEVDFDTLPTTVYPRLNQAVATKFQTDSKYTVGDTEYQSLFAEYKKKCLNDLSKLNTIYLEPNFYKLM